MGRIQQGRFDSKVPTHDYRVLNVTQWRYITVYEEEDEHHQIGIDVCLKTRVHFIQDITLETFNDINHKNEAGQFEYEYKCTHIPCNKCCGKGVIDWIDKVVISDIKEPIDMHLGAINYTRNKQGPVNIYKSFFKSTVMYSSTPKLRVGEEFCPECFGCGIVMSKSKRYGETYFGHC